jgi:hypothetical protein
MSYQEFCIKDYPLHPQMDNLLYPGGSCNLTSVAEALDFFKLKPVLNYGYPQIEDALLAQCDDLGLDRHDPSAIATIARNNGLIDDLSIVSGWNDVGVYIYKKLIPHLQGGKPAIVHGYLTNSGHIVTLVGVRLIDGNPIQWKIIDTYGEFFPRGYEINYGGDPELGKYWLSHSEFTLRMLTGGEFWCHLIDKK